MNIRRIVARIIVIATITATLCTPYSVSAAPWVTTTMTSGNLVQYTYVPYYTYRYTNGAPYRVSMAKPDGPELVIRLRSCHTSAWRNEVRETWFDDADNWTHTRIRPSSENGIYFCLGATSLGNDTYDTFDAEISWWVQ